MAQVVKPDPVQSYPPGYASERVGHSRWEDGASVLPREHETVVHQLSPKLFHVLAVICESKCQARGHCHLETRLGALRFVEHHLAPSKDVEGAIDGDSAHKRVAWGRAVAKTCILSGEPKLA